LVHEKVFMHKYIAQLQIISFKHEMTAPLTWFPLLKLAKFPRVAFVSRRCSLKSAHHRFLAPFTVYALKIHSHHPLVVSKIYSFISKMILTTLTRINGIDKQKLNKRTLVLIQGPLHCGFLIFPMMARVF